MSPRQQAIWINLSGLGVLLASGIAGEIAMHGPVGAAHYATTLRTGSPYQRVRAAEAIAKLHANGVAAAPDLIAVLDRTDDPSTSACAIALKEVDPEAAYEYAEALIAQIESGKAGLTRHAMEIFQGFGPVAWKAIPLLRATLRNRSRNDRRLIPTLIDLGDYGDEVMAAIVEESKNVDPEKKLEAILAFERIGTRALAWRGDLERLSADPAVSGRAKFVLSTISRAPKYALSGFAGFPDQSEDYQEYSLEHIGERVGDPVGGVPDVERELQSRSALIRFLATWTLARMGPPAQAALPQLRAGEADGTRLVRDGAVEAVHVLEATR
jgi:hypothetical protein